MPSASPAGAPETELKFQLGDGAFKSLGRHPAFADPGRKSRLRSTYFDTPEHDLRNGGFSLRVREKDGLFVQTVKRRSGSGLFDRDEWEASVESGQPDQAALARTPAAAVLNGSASELAPVFETAIERNVRLWDDGASIVEVCLDEGEVIAGEQREPVRELELELRAGQPSALFTLAREVAGKTAMTLSFESKAERGYRLAGHDGMAALKAERTPVTGAMTAQTAFRQIARGCLAQVAGNAQLLRRVRSPEVVHQTRVGLRRLRAALSIFKHILDADGLARADAETRWLAGELDEARDIDVFIAGVLGRGDGLSDDPDLEAFGKRLLEAQARAHDKALAAVESPRFSAMLLDISAWVEVGEWAQASPLGLDPAADYGARMLAHLRRRVRKLGEGLVDLDPKTRHRLRIKVKKLRYATEFFAGAFEDRPDRRRKFTAAVRALQEGLGELNDIAMARETAMRVVGRRAGDLAFTAGLLVGRRQKDEPALLASAAAAYDALDGAKPFWREGRGKKG